AGEAVTGPGGIGNPDSFPGGPASPAGFLPGRVPGGPGPFPGQSPPLTINITANLGVTENPLVAAETLAQVREFSVNAAVDAIADRIPGIVAAIQAEGPSL
ncbi:MAG: hypothetical protein ACREDF_07730, partial [Thermoplasmata archaeon]